jgi:MFS family permease
MTATNNIHSPRKDNEASEEASMSNPAPTDQVYSTFTPRQKWLLVCIASIAATFSGAASNIYFPALPTIARDLDVSVTLVNLTVTSYMIFQGLAPSIWGAVADVKGRRLTYICTFIVFLGACIGLANTQNYATLIVLRCLQSTGSASTIAIGSGVIGDITTRAERGGYMGIFQAGLLVPVAAGPIIGGALAGSLGWRSVFWFLTIYSGVFLLILIAALPETLRSIVGNGSRRPHSLLQRQPLAQYQRYQVHPEKLHDEETGESKHIDFLGPFRILLSRQAVLIILFLSIYYAVWQMSITVMSTLFSHIYHLHETEIGLTFIANGVGSMIGTLVTGKILDIDYKRAKAKYVDEEGQTSQKDFPIERARLRLIPIWSLLQCGAILVFGWTLQYRVHISVPIISTFVTGWTAVSIQSTVMTYLVDIFHDKSASASAALNIARCLMGAGGTAAANPLIEAVGAGPCFSILTGVMALGLVMVGLQAWLRKKA